MDLAPNDRRRSVLRPLLFAVFAALTWLIWSAGTANAALLDPDLVPQLTGTGTTTLKDAAATAVPLPAAEPPANTLLPVTDAVTGTVNTVTDSVTDAVTETVAGTLPAVDAGLAEVVGVVDSTVDPALPVVTDVVEIVDGVLPGVVDGVVGVLPGVVDVVDGVVDIVPPAPLPGTDVVSPVLPEMLPPVPGVPLPGQEGTEDGQTSEAPAGQSGIAAIEANSGLTSPSPDGAPAGQITAGTRTGQALLIPPALHALAVMGEPAGSAPVPETPVPGERRLQAALSAGPGSATTGSAGGGAQAWADVPAFWAIPLAARFGRMPSLQELPPAAPPFDPGSTPD